MLTNCLFSVSYAGLWGQHTLALPEFIRHAGKLGYRHVMLAGKRPHLSILDTDEDCIESVRAAMREADVQVPVIGAYVDISGGTAAEVPYLEMQIAYVERLAQVGQLLGSTIIRVFTGYERIDCQPNTLWNTTVAALREMCDRLRPLNMIVAVQNHHDLAVATDALLELLADIDRPNCKLGFDAWSPALRGESLYEAARAAAPQTVITTNADYVKFQRYAYQPDLVNYHRHQVPFVRAVPFGTGIIDYRAFFSGLIEGGFCGIASYEMCSPLRGGGTIDNLDRCARAYIDWMNGHGFSSGDASSGAEDAQSSIVIKN